MSYEAAKKRAEPYTKIVEELPGMRRETVELVRKAVTENWRAYVLVNHRSEGSAPLTISGTQRSTYGCANMIESSICFLSGVGWRTERHSW